MIRRGRREWRAAAAREAAGAAGGEGVAAASTPGRRRERRGALSRQPPPRKRRRHRSLRRRAYLRRSPRFAATGVNPTRVSEGAAARAAATSDPEAPEAPETPTEAAIDATADAVGAVIRGRSLARVFSAWRLALAFNAFARQEEAEKSALVISLWRATTSGQLDSRASSQARRLAGVAGILGASSSDDDDEVGGGFGGGSRGAACIRRRTRCVGDATARRLARRMPPRRGRRRNGAAEDGAPRAAAARLIASRDSAAASQTAAAERASAAGGGRRRNARVLSVKCSARNQRKLRSRGWSAAWRCCVVDAERRHDACAVDRRAASHRTAQPARPPRRVCVIYTRITATNH